MPQRNRKQRGVNRRKGHQMNEKTISEDTGFQVLPSEGQLQDRNRKQKRVMRATISFVVVILALVILFFAAINIGSLQVSFGELLQGLFVKRIENVATIWDLRFPRIMISMLAGAAIAVSGVLFQAVLKNPLADPGIIGISSGASFAAVLITAFAPSLYFFTPLVAFLGGVVAFFLVYCLSWKGGLSPLRIILTGVAVNALFTGLASAFNSMSGGDMTGVASIVEANITQKTWDDVVTLFPYVAAGLILAVLFIGECNLLTLEDKTARSLGVNVNTTRIVISLVAVLLASIATAIAGAISFLGLIVPHIGRILVGSDHKVLVPFSALAGALTFLLADTLGRTIAAPYEVSAAVIMSVIGGPFFILLLRRSTKYAN
ncbi:iron complex transport system permease protein [Hespellia stercorisuis DSM 15480]|uniref:Probable heme-iron transport system permease protein IsdF n=2 Tax=Hespellia stercorisuis TaxID=180311 RepID=A0A1M6I4E8_9FIRM|nr:iron complex transport system permease protein [Hespellia stercorisuis DSM 15480]